jgi:tetratricopeptide (TPR) repeat protein
LNGLANIESQSNRGHQAVEHFTEVLRLSEKLSGKRSVVAARYHANLGMALTADGRPTEAIRELRTASATLADLEGAEHPDLALADYHLARALRVAGQLGAAVDTYAHAEQLVATLPDHQLHEFTRLERGQVFLQMQQPLRARDCLRAAIAHAENRGRTVALLHAQHSLAQAELQLGHPLTALSLTQKVLAKYLATKVPGLDLVTLQMDMARTLWAIDRRPTRALPWARQAETVVTAAKDGKRLADVQRWIREHSENER